MLDDARRNSVVHLGARHRHSSVGTFRGSFASHCRRYWKAVEQDVVLVKIVTTIAMATVMALLSQILGPDLV